MPPLTIESAITRLLAHLRIECGLAENTLAAYARDLRDLRRDLASQGIEDVAALNGRALVEHVRALRAHRKLASASVVRHVASVRIFCRFLAAEGHASEELGALIERPTQWKKIPGVLSQTRMEQLLASPSPADAQDARALPLWLRDRALLELLYACGLRASEAADLPQSGIFFELGFVKVTGKGNRQRLVPFGKPAERHLRRYLDECRPRLAKGDGRDGDRVFLSRTGRPLERVAVWQIVKKHAARAGVERVYPHLLRHSFATHLLSGGADLRVVQELLGHSRISTTEIYTRVDQPRLREVVRKYHPRG